MVRAGDQPGQLEAQTDERPCRRLVDTLLQLGQALRIHARAVVPQREPLLTTLGVTGTAAKNPFIQSVLGAALKRGDAG